MFAIATTPGSPRHPAGRDDRIGAASLEIITFHDWSVERIFDRGYFLIRLDTFGGERYDYYALARSTGFRMKATLVRDRRSKPDFKVARSGHSAPATTASRFDPGEDANRRPPGLLHVAGADVVLQQQVPLDLHRRRSRQQGSWRNVCPVRRDRRRRCLLAAAQRHTHGRSDADPHRLALTTGTTRTT